jgi:hypothetical protein
MKILFKSPQSKNISGLFYRLYSNFIALSTPTKNYSKPVSFRNYHRTTKDCPPASGWL